MATKKQKRPALGRGLNALFPETPTAPAASRARPSDAPTGTPPPEPADRVWKMVAIERLRPNPDQPRKRFPPGPLQDLAASIRAQGIIQPIVAVPLPGQPGTYSILAGERRWRAAQIAGLHEVPIVVRDTPEAERLELALVENLQRADLDPIEEALAYERLIELHDYTQAALAERVGKDRSTVANAIRLLRLPEKVRGLVQENRLSMGHARALLGLESDAQMVELAQEVVRRGLSVRATEKEVRDRLRPPEPPLDDEAKRQSIIIGDLEARLRRHLGTKVVLRTGKNRRGPGKIEVSYSSLDELNRILKSLLAREAE